MDEKDKKILYQLDCNARQSCAQIAKKVGLSSEVVNYRIKQLEKENIITQYKLIAILFGLGMYQYKLCLSLSHITSIELEEALTEIKKIQEVKWLVSTKGTWDLLVACEVNEFEKIDHIKNTILSYFGRSVKAKSLSFLLDAQTYDRVYLQKEKEESKTRIISQPSQKVTIDEIDMNILKFLAQDARTPVATIAVALKETGRKIAYRIKQLEKKNVIVGYKIAINYEKLGIKFYKTFIHIDNPQEKRMKALHAYLEQDPSVIHTVRVLGNWELEPEFEVYTEKEFFDKIQTIKDMYADIIHSVDIVTIEKEHKFVYF